MGLQPDDLFAEGHEAFPHEEHADVPLQGESCQLAGALPLTLQQLVDVLLQKHLPHTHKCCRFVLLIFLLLCKHK